MYVQKVIPNYEKDGRIRPVKARFAQGLDSAVFRVCNKP